MKLIKRYLAYATNIREFIISFEKTYYWSEFVKTYRPSLIPVT